MLRIIIDNIKKAIDIKQSEKRTFQILFIHALLIGLANAFFFVEASRNFILKANISEIPVAYILSGIIGFFLIQILKYLQRKFGNTKSYRLTILIFCFLMLFLFAGQFYFDKSIVLVKVFAYLGFVLIFAFVTLFGVGFTGICITIFNLSQSKRLLALLGTGEIISSIIGFLVIPFIIKVTLSSNYLLLIASFFSIVSLWPIRVIEKEMPNNINNLNSEIKNTKYLDLKFIFSNPFVIYLTLTTLFSIIAVYFIDYSYLISVRYFSTLTGIEVATIVAILFSVIKTGELVFSFFSLNIISSIGMKRSVSLLPLLLIIVSILGVFSILFFGSTPIFVVFFLFINKWVDRVIRKSVYVPATKIMFQINTPQERLELQNNIDGVISQLSTIICGILLFVVCFFSDTSNFNSILKIITLVCSFLFILFIIFSNKLYIVYKSKIQEYLKNIYIATNFEKSRILEFVPTISIDEIYNSKFIKIYQDSNLSDKKELLNLILYYNTAANTYLKLSDIESESEDYLQRKLSKLFFDNQNYFSRLLIISYYFNYDFNTQLSFYKEIDKVSTLSLKSFFLEHIATSNDIIDSSQEFYFNELLTEYVGEIFWTEYVINDLKDSSLPKLIKQLELHHLELTKTLLHLIQILHDKKSISIIKTIFNKSDKSDEDLFFIVELLENILKPELKNIVLPIFEPISFFTRKNILQTHFFFTQHTVNDRLLDVLMHNFNTIDIYTKQLALEALKKLNPDSDVIKAFKSSKILPLNLSANTNENLELDKNTDLQIIELASLFCNYFSLDEKYASILIRWCFKENTSSLFSKSKDDLFNMYANNTIRIPNQHQHNSFIDIDLLAPVLLNKTPYFLNH